MNPFEVPKINFSKLKLQKDALNPGDNEKVSEVLNKAIKYLKSLEKWYKNFLEADAQKYAENTALALVKEQYNNILWDRCEQALEINQEFNFPAYKSRLKKLCKHPRAFKITVDRGKISIYNNLDEIGGSLEEYHAAVKQTREVLDIGKMPTEYGGSGRAQSKKKNTASTFFYNNFYSAARLGKSVNIYDRTRGYRRNKTDYFIRGYWDVMSTRENFFVGIAPFWEIVNEGHVKFTDDVGGVSFVEAYPTLFVEKAIQQVKELYETVYKEKVLNFEDARKNSLLIYEQYKKTLQDIIMELSRLRSSTTAVVRKSQNITERALQAKKLLERNARIEKIQILIEKALGEERLLKARSEKIIELAKTLVSGGQVKSRVYLGGGIQLRTKRILEGLDD